MSDYILHFNHVGKRYLNGHDALKDISFQFYHGEMAFLTGHSGAGKSTLLKIISMMERPSHGQVMLDGHNITRLSPSRIPFLRRNIGFVFQNPRLISNHTVFDNVALPLIISGVAYPEIKKRVRASLEKVGLGRYEKVLPQELSGGEQQRVGIARAIVNKPPLILADEPTGNLDAQLSLDIMRLFSDFNQVGVSVLVATHDQSLINHFDYRVLTLQSGQLETVN